MSEFINVLVADETIDGAAESIIADLNESLANTPFKDRVMFHSVDLTSPEINLLVQALKPHINILILNQHVHPDVTAIYLSLLGAGIPYLEYVTDIHDTHKSHVPVLNEGGQTSLRENFLNTLSRANS